MSAKKEMKSEDLKKAIQGFVDECFDDEDTAIEDLRKSQDADGDNDPAYKAGYAAAMKKMKKSDDEDKDDEETFKAKKSEGEDDEEDVEKSEDEDDCDEDEMKSKKKMKKSVRAEGDSIRKSISTLTETVASLAQTVGRLNKSTVGIRRSVTGLEVLHKGQKEDAVDEGNDNKQMDAATLAKSRAKIAEVMFEDGVQKGLITPQAVAEFEFAGQIADSKVRNLVKSMVRKRQSEGLL